MHISPTAALRLTVIITGLLTWVTSPTSAQTPTTSQNTNLTLLAQGSLIAYAYPADTNTVPLRTADFTLERSGNDRWTLLITNIQYRTEFLNIVPMLDSGNVASVEFSSDGKYTTHVLTWNLEKMKAPGAPPQIRNTFGTAHPKNMEPIEAAPWLMFCIPPNLLTNIAITSTSTGSNFPPTNTDRHTAGTLVSVTNHLPNIFMTLSWPTNHIPCTLDWDQEKGYLRHGQFWKPGHGNIGLGSKGISTVTLPPPYDKGFLATTHEILSEPAPRQNVTKNTPIIFQQNHYHVTPSPKPKEKVEPTLVVIIQSTITNLQSKASAAASP